MLRWLFAALCLLVPVLSSNAAEPAGPVYELRIYTCEAGKLPALEERFRDHTMRIFEKHGMKNLAYWKPIEGETAETTLIYLLEHASREAAQASWQGFRNDPEWKQVAAASEQKYGKILARPPEVIFLSRTDYSPNVGLPSPGKVFELRTYTAAEGKLDALNARFRDHTDRIFKKHGMQSYGYWVPMDAPKSENTLIYVLEHAGRDAATASWKAFRDDPEWQAAFQASQATGSLTAARPEAVYMQLTDFSPAGK